MVEEGIRRDRVISLWGKQIDESGFGHSRLGSRLVQSTRKFSEEQWTGRWEDQVLWQNVHLRHYRKIHYIRTKEVVSVPVPILVHTNRSFKYERNHWQHEILRFLSPVSGFSELVCIPLQVPKYLDAGPKKYQSPFYSFYYYHNVHTNGQKYIPVVNGEGPPSSGRQILMLERGRFVVFREGHSSVIQFNYLHVKPRSPFII